MRMAASGYLSVQDGPGGGGTPSSVSRAWSSNAEGSLGGVRFWIYALFEALVIDWLKEAATLAVSRQMKLRHV